MKQARLESLDYSVLQQCMHCGMCLPSCPTYTITKRERNSPRGRIAWMRGIADGEMQVDEAFADEMSYCLGCLACTSACPAGVDYAHMLEVARSEVESREGNSSFGRKALRWATLRVLFTRPRLLRAVGRVLGWHQKSGFENVARRLGLTTVLSPELQELEKHTPRVQPSFSHELIKGKEVPKGEARFRVAVLTGCVQDLLYSDVNRATVDVLLENGCEVVTPEWQHCCGSLHAHNGDLETAELLAKKQIDSIDPFRFDAIISNAGGCGSHLKHYDRLLADDSEYAERAVEWSRKLKDISEWLVEIGFRKPKSKDRGEGKQVMTYHEACHLCHGQGVSSAPRALLSSLPQQRLKECAGANECCGSAGIYSITQPDTANALLEKKLNKVLATEPSVIATGNPGCQLHMENGLRARGREDVRIAHPVVLLAEAYREEKRDG